MVQDGRFFTFLISALPPADTFQMLVHNTILGFCLKVRFFQNGLWTPKPSSVSIFCISNLGLKVISQNVAGRVSETVILHHSYDLSLRKSLIIWRISWIFYCDISQIIVRLNFWVARQLTINGTSILMSLCRTIVAHLHKCAGIYDQ